MASAHCVSSSRIISRGEGGEVPTSRRATGSVSRGATGIKLSPSFEPGFVVKSQDHTPQVRIKLMGHSSRDDEPGGDTCQVQHIVGPSDVGLSCSFGK